MITHKTRSDGVELSRQSDRRQLDTPSHCDSASAVKDALSSARRIREDNSTRSKSTEQGVPTGTSRHRINSSQTGRQVANMFQFLISCFQEFVQRLPPETRRDDKQAGGKSLANSGANDGGIPNRVGPDVRVGPQDPGGPAAHPEDHIRGRPSPQPGGPTRLRPGFGRRWRWR